MYENKVLYLHYEKIRNMEKKIKKATEYAVTMINQHKQNLIDALLESIYDMLGDVEGNFSIDFTMSATKQFKYLELDWTEDGVLNQIDVEYEYTDTDGLMYSTTERVEDLGVDELYCLWKYLNEK